MKCIYYALPAIIALVSCTDNQNQVYDNVPYVYVYEEIYLTSIEAQPLTLRDGTYIYHKGGLKGLIIYRQNSEKYLAFERASTAAGQCQVKADGSGFFMTDTCSSTQFQWDGTVRGTAPYPLKQYNVNKDNQRLVITN